jgi:uncharacterized membrane protein
MIDYTSVFVIFGGFILSLVGMMLMYASKSERVSRKEFMQWIWFGLIPFLGWVFGAVTLYWGVYYFVYMDHKD